MKIFVLFLILIPTICFAEWGQEDTARELLFTYTLVIDWKQTRDIAKNPNLFEKNVFIGRKPSLEKVNTYFAVCLFGHSLISWMLKGEYREYWQLFWIGIQSNQIGKNYDLGLKEHVGMEYQISYSIPF